MAADGMSIINSHIEKGSFSKVYLLMGDEKYLMHQYKNKLLDALCDRGDTMNFISYKSDGVKADVIDEFASTMPFFADRRVVLVEGSDFFKKGNEDVEKIIGNLPETTVLVFVEDNVDKRNKLYKLVDKTGTVVSFATPDEQTLVRWIAGLFAKDSLKVENAAVYRLIEGVGMDMTKLSNEVEKLKCYCFEKGQITVEDVEALCVDEIEGKIFDMMDALSLKDKKKTLDLYDGLMNLREPAMRLLYLIARQFNILLKIKLSLEEGVEAAKIASVVKVPPFTVKKYINQTKGYTYKELLKCVEMCQMTDTNIKTGVMKDGVAVELLILNLLQG